MGRTNRRDRHSLIQVPAPMTSFPMVVVRWVDACGDGGERTVDVLPTPFTVVTIGALARDEEDYVVIAQDVYFSSDKTEFRTTVAIPRGMIQSIERYGDVTDEVDDDRRTDS